MKHTKYLYRTMYRVKDIEKISSEFSPYRFLKYESGDVEDDTKEIYYALGIVIDLDKPLMQKAIRTLEKYYEIADDEEKKTDFDRYDFDENGKLILNDKAKELGKCQLVFTDVEFPKHTLYINILDFFQHYLASDLDENIPEIVSALLDADLIEAHKTRIDVNKK